MSTVKKEARLSGMLLARKGTAAPAHTDHRLTIQAMDQFKKPEPKVEIPKELNGHEQQNWTDAVSQINDVTRKQYGREVASPDVKEVPKVAEKIEKVIKSSTKAFKSAKMPQRNTKVDGKRVAMTLRMEQEEHLKLRLYAAHSRKSCQEIISDALEMYLNKNENLYSMSDCSCLSK
ncbi:MAG: hypothetical protein P8J14_07225 [Emcibacteraceae bacterium]|nr:hypothetical protein [Emcibacteraceae bacterium]